MYYFAYASNLNRQEMQRCCPGSQPLYSAVLPNYRLVFAGWSRKWRGATAGIKPMRDERVRGAIYEISEACLRQLDGQDTGYQRQAVTVFNRDDEPVAAVTYLHAGQPQDGKPAPEYLAVIQQGLRDWRLF